MMEFSLSLMYTFLTNILLVLLISILVNETNTSCNLHDYDGGECVKISHHILYIITNLIIFCDAKHFHNLDYNLNTFMLYLLVNVFIHAGVSCSYNGRIDL